MPLHCRGNQASRICLSSLVNQRFEKLEAGWAKASFVGHRLDDYGSAVPITSDHFTQLVLGVCQSSRILPLNGPVNRNFGPHHQSESVCLSDHLLVVRIVGQTNKITA